jgi:hypothetical protein
MLDRLLDSNALPAFLAGCGITASLTAIVLLIWGCG